MQNITEDETEKLKECADLSRPHTWFPNARALHRKIVFHVGPTNSGKTYEALEMIKKADSGVYCAPLKLLAAEVYQKLNKSGVPCDFVTGDQRKYAVSKSEPANHLSTTAEMLPLNLLVDMAVIDEIQMVRDFHRGFAFTRAVLGVAAFEVHLLEVRRYERKTPLVISTHGLNGLQNIRDGDCIVSFRKRNLFDYVTKLNLKHGRESAIIFGDLPASMKLTQAAKFNDPKDSCKVLVSTDAVGMGINLDIRRIIFSELTKKDGTLIEPHLVRQIAGRAGRFGFHEIGTVLAMDEESNNALTKLMHEPIKDISKAGILPTLPIMEAFSAHMPGCSLLTLLNKFGEVCSVSADFFLCDLDDIRRLALATDHVSLPTLKEKWLFCACYGQGNAITYEFLVGLLKDLLSIATSVEGFNRLSDAYDVVGGYLWLSYRFPDRFPDVDKVSCLEGVIEERFRESLEFCMKKKTFP
uniref:RNA helicase n=1 Tax=Ditylenchus dipsaci TaxID=166011 RepID=A0A915ENB3_9BILA